MGLADDSLLLRVLWSILDVELYLGERLAGVLFGAAGALGGVASPGGRAASVLEEVEERIARVTSPAATAFRESLILRPLRWAVERRGFLSPHVLIPLLFAVYVVLALISPLPVLYPETEVLGLFLWTIGISSYVAGLLLGERVAGRMGEIRPPGPKRLTHFALPLVSMGIVGLAYSYFSRGSIPLLYPELRRHDEIWSLSYSAFVLGVGAISAAAAALREEGTLDRGGEIALQAALAVGTVALTFPSGFRLDVFVALGTLVLTMWMMGSIRARTVVVLLALPMAALFVGQKMILMAKMGLAGDPWYVSVSRAGFTLHCLTLVLKDYGPAGRSWGVLLFLNPILTMMGIPRPLIGPLTGEAAVGRPVAYTTSLVGPIWIDFGAAGVVLVPLAIGLIGGAVFRLASSTPRNRRGIFAAFNGILTSAMMVWIESGPVHPYLYAMYPLALIGILATKRKRRGE